MEVVSKSGWMSALKITLLVRRTLDDFPASRFEDENEEVETFPKMEIP